MNIKVTDSEIKGLITQKPNSNVLGYPLRLNLYNLAKENIFVNGLKEHTEKYRQSHQYSPQYYSAKN